MNQKPNVVSMLVKYQNEVVLLFIPRENYITCGAGITALPPEDKPKYSSYLERDMVNFSIDSMKDMPIRVDESITSIDGNIYFESIKGEIEGLSLDVLFDKASNLKAVRLAKSFKDNIPSFHSSLPGHAITIPPLSKHATQLMNWKSMDNVPLDAVIDCVKNDPPLAAQLIAMVQSPVYYRGVKTTSISDAVKRVGLSKTVNLGVALALSRSLRSKLLGAKELHSYWLKAVSMADITEKLAASKNLDVSPDTAYLMGLLADFAYLLVPEFFPESFDTWAFLHSVNQHINPIQLDLEALNMDTAALIGRVFTLWEMPQAITNGIKNQWQSSNIVDLAMEAQILIVARYIYKMAVQYTSSNDDLAKRIIDKHQLHALVDKIISQYSSLYQ
jgi:HD-like signal output (HDOD) protein